MWIDTYERLTANSVLLVEAELSHVQWKVVLFGCSSMQWNNPSVHASLVLNIIIILISSPVSLHKGFDFPVARSLHMGVISSNEAEHAIISYFTQQSVDNNPAVCRIHLGKQSSADNPSAYPIEEDT